jgi:EmrB/QacA subfamily drug resistance transporter
MQSSTAPEPALNRTLPLVLAVALFMEHMDSTVISTALPAIATDMGTSPIALKLALTSYLVALAIFIPISGWMADRYGAKPVFRSAIAVFVVGSVLCAISGSLPAFVGSRFLQGMGGAMMSPIARLVLVRSTPRNQLVGAMAWLTIPGLVGPLVGPPVGGFITTYVSWHWIFIINVPIGLAGIIVSGFVLPKVKGQEPRPMDWAGFLLAAICAAGLVFGLSVISLPALPPLVGVATTLLGVGAGIVYVRHSQRTPNPILDLSLFRRQSFRAAILGGTMFRIGTGAVPFLLPLMFQLIFGLSPFHSGLLTFVSAIGALSMKFLATATLRAAGFRTVIVATAISGGIMIGANALFTIDTPYPAIMATLVASGFLRSLFFTSTNVLVFTEIGDRETGQATAIAAACQQISVALGVACAGGLLEVVTALSGGTLDHFAFVVAFLAASCVSVLAALCYVGLPRDIGHAMSGHAATRVAAAAGGKDRPELQE